MVKGKVEFKFSSVACYVVIVSTNKYFYDASSVSLFTLVDDVRDLGWLVCDVDSTIYLGMSNGGKNYIRETRAWILGAFLVRTLSII